MSGIAGSVEHLFLNWKPFQIWTGQLSTNLQEIYIVGLEFIQAAGDSFIDLLGGVGRSVWSLPESKLGGNDRILSAALQTHTEYFLRASVTLK